MGCCSSRTSEIISFKTKKELMIYLEEENKKINIQMKLLEKQNNEDETFIAFLGDFLKIANKFLFTIYKKNLDKPEVFNIIKEFAHELYDALKREDRNSLTEAEEKIFKYLKDVPNEE